MLTTIFIVIFNAKNPTTVAITIPKMKHPTSEPVTVSLPISESSKISDKIPERVGYDFLGWKLAENTEENNIDYNPGDKISLNEDVKLYAVWLKQKEIYELL